MALYGATIGGSAILINFLSRATFPEVPQHMSLAGSLFFGSVGAFTGGIITAPVAYLLYGGLPTFSFTARPKRGPRSPLAWGALGVGYGLIFPMLFGIFLPIFFRFLAFKNGLINVPELISSMIDLTMSSPFLAPILGSQYFFTGLTAGLLFGAGAWIIDIFNSSKDPATARYGTWAMAVVLSLVVVAVLLYVPETILAKGGRLG